MLISKERVWQVRGMSGGVGDKLALCKARKDGSKRTDGLTEPNMKSNIMAERIFTVDLSPSAVAYVNIRHKSRLFPSMRLLLAALLCLCFVALGVTSNNLAMAVTCMLSFHVDGYSGKLEWTHHEKGMVFAGQNVGSLLMLTTGAFADRLNSKLLVVISVVLSIVSNLMIALFARQSVWFVVVARVLVGASDACLQPSVNSLITRWFPASERTTAIGLITGGRQIGALLIYPTAGYLCTRKSLLEGWPSIFYFSAIMCTIALLFWLPLGADKPSKQACISKNERLYIDARVACESLGKRTHRPPIPWNSLLRSTPLWVGIFALVCHEFPLIIVMQFLPSYLCDVLKVSPMQNGFYSALPHACLWWSKTASSSLSSVIEAKTEGILSKTTVAKLFNAVASTGLAICLCSVPLLNKSGNDLYAIYAICGAMSFAGLHTPGVQTALVQLAPPFSGVVTGLACFFVACFSITNKMLTADIVQTHGSTEWQIVFQLSAMVAAFPIIVFSVWGSAERQHWAAPTIDQERGQRATTLSSQPLTTSTISTARVIPPPRPA